MDESSQAAPAGDDGESGGRVVVGVDGSPGSRAALVWAFAAAARRGVPLEVVATFPVDFYWADPYLLDSARVDQVRADTQQRAQAMVDEVRADPVAGSDDVAVEVVVAAGPAAELLVHHASDTDLLVVGSRGRGAVRSTVLGSVALHVVTHAHCPVVVVRPRSHGAGARARVVVGVDGSEPSRAALVQAAAEARGLDAELLAVAAFERQNYWSDLYAPVYPTTEKLRDDAEGAALKMVQDELGGAAGLRVLEGAASDVLVREAEGAELLVVGSRGRGMLRGMLLGSVALHCVLSAPCPVMVVRSRGAGSGAE
ncbi:MAG: universal stress protein [Blastococcus sp.]